jgi:hypothetical protein
VTVQWELLGCGIVVKAGIQLTALFWVRRKAMPRIQNSLDPSPILLMNAGGRRTRNTPSPIVSLSGEVRPATFSDGVNEAVHVMVRAAALAFKCSVATIVSSDDKPHPLSPRMEGTPGAHNKRIVFPGTANIGVLVWLELR